MINTAKSKIYKTLRWSEKYAKTDMVYLAKGGFWLTLGQIISSLSSLFLSIAFANLLSPEIYGTYRYVLSVCGILAIPALAGMGTAMTRAVARGFEGSAIPVMKAKIRWGLIGGLGGLILAVYYYFGNNQQLAICFLIASFFLPVMDAFSIYDAVLIGKKDFCHSTKYAVISQIIAVTLLIVAIALTHNLYIIVMTYFLSWTVMRAFFFILTLKKFKLNKEIDQSTVSYGKHLSFMSIIGSVANYLDRLLLFHFLGSVEVAIYSIAIAPPEQFKGLFKNINILSLPKLAENDKNQSYPLKLILEKSLKVVLFSGVIVIVYIIIAPLAFKLFFPKYMASVFYSQIFSISLISAALMVPLTLLQARAHKKSLYKYNIISSVFQIASLIIFIPFFGIMGAVMARVFSRILNFFIILFLVRNNTD